MYQLTSQSYIKAILVFAFSVLFHAYAYEAGLQFIIITFFTAVILIYMMKFFETIDLYQDMDVADPKRINTLWTIK